MRGIREEKDKERTNQYTRQVWKVQKDRFIPVTTGVEGPLVLREVDRSLPKLQLGWRKKRRERLYGTALLLVLLAAGCWLAAPEIE